MKATFPRPPRQAIILEDAKLYATLASFPIAKGHTVVVWKKPVRDLHLLGRKDYEHLMDAVDDVRSAMLKALGVKKVYLIYMDEANHVHWHLVPRYNVRGFDAFKHRPGRLKDFSLAVRITKFLKH